MGLLWCMKKTSLCKMTLLDSYLCVQLVNFQLSVGVEVNPVKSVESLVSNNKDNCRHEKLIKIWSPKLRVIFFTDYFAVEYVLNNIF